TTFPITTNTITRYPKDNPFSDQINQNTSTNPSNQHHDPTSHLSILLHANHKKLHGPKR
ncbi:5291_t:CDS:1, partial [Funneliformis caledonium]